MSKISQNIEFVQFGTLSTSEWISFAPCQIYKPSPQGGSDKNKEGTPYDPRMGCLENGLLCATCGEDNRACPGHFGHIVLPIPIYNKTFISKIVQILQCVCPICSGPRIKKDQAYIQMGKSKDFKRLSNFAKICKKVTECPHGCGVLPSFDLVNKSEIMKHYGTKTQAVPFKAGEAHTVLKRISNETLHMIGINCNLSLNKEFTNPEILSCEKQHIHQIRPESFIYEVFPVISPLSRPFIVRDGQKCDDDLTDKYNSILKCCIKINSDERSKKFQEVKKGKKVGVSLSEKDRQKLEQDLQNHIWTLMDNRDEKSKLSSGGRAHKSIRERLEKKEGLVQSNICGKRCDFTCRTVIIGGGISLKMDNLGVPRIFAENLTKPVNVKEWNKEYAIKLVKDGKVNRVIRGDKTIRLDLLPDKGRKFNIQLDDIIERQLQDGDIFPFNRQPSLRKESILSFKVKIIEGYAFRLGLCWTKAFNADFDGDEMNAHVPQSITATVESQVLLRAAANIVTGQKNAPINGIVQDGLVGSYLMTNTWKHGEKYTMIEVDTYIDCIEDMEIPKNRLESFMFRALDYYPEYIKIENGKAIFSKKEIPGKLAYSILFPQNLCYERKTETNPDFPYVKIEDGILLPESGPICKNTIGAKANAVIHVLWKDYSPEVALCFLSDTQQLTDRWLPTHGFSMGISDCLATSKEDVARVKSEMHSKINNILARCNGKPDLHSEIEINGILNSAMNVGLRLAKTSMAKDDRNALNIMRNSGAKGSVVNLVQIVAFVGQQNVAGQRIPPTISGGRRTLPHYDMCDHSAESRGFVENCYLTGLTPSEVFFHAMGGREGIIATAIKSVTWGTPLIIIENGKSKRVLIGEWIDKLMEENPKNIEYYPEENNLQVLKVKNVFIPTADSHGKTSWEDLTQVTRHDPGKNLYKVKTESGREVTVAESKSLLIWDESTKEFLPKHTPDVKIGECVPVAYHLPRPPVIKKHIEMSDYFPKTEYIYGTDMIRAYKMLEECDFKPKRGWWGKHNGTTFTLPYKFAWQLLRNFKRTDMKGEPSKIEDYREGCVYPRLGKRIDTVFPEKLELDYDNGFFIGLYIADGDSNVKCGHVRVSKNDEVIQSKIKEWFEKYNIKYETYRRENEMGHCDSIRGFSVMWARFFIETCGHGAKNKKVPNESFIAHQDFVAGLIDGYISGDGCVRKDTRLISASSISERLIEEIGFLLSLFGIFSMKKSRQQKSNNLGTENIHKTHILEIKRGYVNKFYDSIKLTHPKKFDRVKNLRSQKWRKTVSEPAKNKSCIKDKIINIEKINPKDPFLYDVTVPEVSYFGLASGIVTENTAETGYIQKRIGRKIEDFKIDIDGTVRDSNNNIIQFVYGDDGMDPQKLCYPYGIDFPFFINPINLATRLNSDAKRQRKDHINSDNEKRILEDKEVDSVLNYIRIGNSENKSEILKLANENCKNILRKLLKNPKTAVYEPLIPAFCREIWSTFESSKVQYGEMVGLNAGSSIGEPTTQLCQVGSTRCVIREVRGVRKLNEVKYGTIGDIIDKYFEEFQDEVVNIGKGSEVWIPSVKIYIPTVNTENEKVEWKKLSELSRHPTNGDLVRIKTKTKREITSTLTHSHLTRTKEGKIISAEAGKLQKGDRIPVNKRMNNEVLYKSIRIQKKQNSEFERKTSTKFDFDFDNGWLFGAYLAEGNIFNKTSLKITNISEYFEKRTKFFADRYHGKMKTVESCGKISPEYPEYHGKEYIVNHIPHIVRFILRQCKTGSADKQIPPFSLFAPLEFVSGLLRGYFDGDGNVNAERQMIRVHSISLNLLEQIALLLSRFGIFGSFGVEKKERKNKLHSYMILRKHAKAFLDNIGSDFPEKVAKLKKIVEYNERKNVHSQREDIDRIPFMGEEIAKVARPLKLSGYSRNYGRWERSGEPIGRETLKKYREIFSQRAEDLEQQIDLSLIDQAVNSDIVWDEITEIEIIEDPKELVYDFGVDGNHTFMNQNGVFTHNTLNSVEWNTEILTQSKNKSQRVKIGKWIDELIKNSPTKNIQKIQKNRTEYLELTNETFIPTVDNQGLVNWGKITAVTRHLPEGKLVKIKTQSGRSAIATRSKSFLVWSGSEFVPTKGSEIKVGDRIPVTIHLMDYEDKENFLEQYVSENKKINKDIFKLSEDFGFVIGSYIANGYSIESTTVIFNSKHNLEKIGLWCKSLLITYNITGDVDKENCGYINIYSDLVVNLFNNWIGYDSSKRIPSESFSESKNFAKGILNGFLSSNNTVYKTDDCLVVVSISKDLITDISALISRFSVFGNVSKYISKNTYPKFYTLSIRKEWFVNNWKKDDKLSAQDTMKMFENNNIHYYEIQNDVILDTIISIKDYVSENEYVYDLTVPSTYNFCIYNGFGMRDTFHLAGVADKDVSLGVPRFNELLNGTKSDKQKKCSCTVEFDIPILNKNAEAICKIEKSKSKGKDHKTNESFLKHLKEISSDTLQTMKNDFEEITVGTFFVDYEMNYIAEDVNTETGFSPIKIIKYTEYKKKWWVELREKLYGSPKIEPNNWVLTVKLDTEEMFKRNIDLEDIAISINNDDNSGGKYYCVHSPNIYGLIEVYCNFSEIRQYAKSKLDVNSSNNKKELITDDNIDFFICREITLKYIKNICISGIEGSSKVKFREDPKTHRWLMDVECRKVPSKISNARFLDILTSEGVDPYKTLTDDVHAINNILGIEAARNFLIQEKTRVISFDGTYINHRHIQLLVDGMTHTGQITSVRRDGIPREVGPIAKIMFEQAVDNAVQAAAFGEVDKVKSVSSSIMYGMTANSGTGVVNIKSIDKMPSYPLKLDKEDLKIECYKHKNKEKPIEKSSRLRKIAGSRRKNIIKEFNEE